MDWSLNFSVVYTFAKSISPVIVMGAAVYGGYLCISGFLPVLIRLGNGLKKRKIAIFAKGAAFDSLQALFDDSKLFSSKNIVRVTSESDFGRSEGATVFLVHWPDWTQDMAKIIQRKKDATALVVYAPQGAGFIPPETMLLLEQHRNVVVANLRGRLLNDVVVSLITSGYEKA